jgi:hypothetical protein
MFSTLPQKTSICLQSFALLQKRSVLTWGYTIEEQKVNYIINQ